MIDSGRWMRADSGSALLAATLLVALITGAGLTAFTTSSMNHKKSQNLLNVKQAFYLAESGIAHGRWVLSNQVTANPTLWTAYATPQPQTLIPTTPLAGMGSYTVTVQEASGPGLLIKATGTAAHGAAMTVSSLVIRGYPNNGMVMIADKALLISGNPTIDGTAGGIHANGDLTITGSPTIATDAEATGNYFEPGPGHPVVGGYKGGGQPRLSINRVILSTYTNAIDYLLTTETNYIKDPVTKKRVAVYSALVTDSQGHKQPMSNNTWNCWEWTPPLGATPTTWALKAPCVTKVNGTFYVNGNAVILADMGTVLDPWIVTIIANGSVKIASNSLYMRAPLPTDGPLFKQATENVIIIAYTDVLFQGNPTQSYTGITRSREQVGISGALVYNGYITAQDGAPADYGQLFNSSSISGDAHLTYNGNMQNGIQGTIVVESMLY